MYALSHPLPFNISCFANPHLQALGFDHTRSALGHVWS